MTHSRNTQPLALIMIVVGLGLLLTRWLNLDFGDVAWPFFVILPGLALLGVALLGQARLAPLAVPGAVVAGTGGILFALNLTDRWEAWAYLWALYPIFVGLAMRLVAQRQDTPVVADRGQRLIWSGATMLAVFGVLFEMFIFNNGFGVLRAALPLVLVAAGVVLLLAKRVGTGRKAKAL